ncbi:MAG: hypothetical protein CVU91_13160 [Firmicutes bacterium HGW-Firmicutes-16]|nr:MAG: hypothetical protein CVU91_13160 [Firmicutes bacterium HGW-Firmicutes-16]
MDKFKIKNFILILLTLVNVFLLFIVITNVIEERKAQASRMEALENVLAEKGFTLNPDIELPDSVPPLLSLKRDMKTEKHNLSSLIGSCSVSDLGGNIFFYSGLDGEGRFRGTGEFEIILNPGVISKRRDPVGASKTALKKLGLECGELEPLVTTDGNDTTVVLSCSWDGTDIYDARVTFNFTYDNLLLISGTRPLDAKFSVQSSDNYPDSVTILMNFLKSAADTGFIFSEINDLKIEYYMYSAVSGSCTLKPVWCITTNSGPYYIDAETGKAENIESVS